MDDKLLKVKIVFDKVREMRNEIGTLFEGLEGRISKLTEVYTEFIKNTNKIKTADVSIFIFSLDSFYFQNNLLKREYKYLINYYNIIVNRMYGEYYKLYKIIVDYVYKSQLDNKLSEMMKNRKYPKYDDLNDEKQYEFSLIVQLNEDIINIVTHLINILRDKEHELNTYLINQGYGLNVNNFVSTFNYEVVVLKEQIILYEKYLDFFYHIHEKLLKRLITKISLLEAQINTEIKFEGGLIGKRKDTKALMSDMNMTGMNKRVAKDLRRSIIGNKSPSSSSTDYDISDKYHEENDFIAIEQPPNTLNGFDTEIIETQTVFIMPKSNNTSLIQQIFENYENVDTDIQNEEEQYVEQTEEEEDEDVEDVEEHVEEDVEEDEEDEEDVEDVAEDEEKDVEEHVEEDVEEHVEKDEEETVENMLDIEHDAVQGEEEHAIVLDVVEKCIDKIVTNNENTTANVDANTDDVINNNP